MGGGTPSPASLRWRGGGPRPRHGRLAYYNPDHTPHHPDPGDALWRDGFGIPFAEVMGQGDALGEARRTLEAIGRLAVDVVIPGHGVFAEFDDALERALQRAPRLRDDGARMAQRDPRLHHLPAARVRSMALVELPRHPTRPPLYRTANARPLGLDADALRPGWWKGERAGARARHAGRELRDDARARPTFAAYRQYRSRARWTRRREPGHARQPDPCRAARRGCRRGPALAVGFVRPAPPPHCRSAAALLRGHPAGAAAAPADKLLIDEGLLARDYRTC